MGCRVVNVRDLDTEMVFSPIISNNPPKYSNRVPSPFYIVRGWTRVVTWSVASISPCILCRERENLEHRIRFPVCTLLILFVQ